MSDLVNITKDEALKVIGQAVSEDWINNPDKLEANKGRFETALRIALAHLAMGETTDVGTAVDAIFEMYRRNNSVDKSYRNAARFILSIVDKVPARYESYDDEDANFPRLENATK